MIRKTVCLILVLLAGAALSEGKCKIKVNEDGVRENKEIGYAFAKGWNMIRFWFGQEGDDYYIRVMYTKSWSGKIVIGEDNQMTLWLSSGDVISLDPRRSAPGKRILFDIFAKVAEPIYSMTREDLELLAEHPLEKVDLTYRKVKGKEVLPEILHDGGPTKKKHGAKMVEYAKCIASSPED